jgi:hypothetical protein
MKRVSVQVESDTSLCSHIRTVHGRPVASISIRSAVVIPGVAQDPHPDRWHGRHCTLPSYLHRGFLGALFAIRRLLMLLDLVRLTRLQSRNICSIPCSA